MAPRKKELINLPVQFGSLSIGKTTAKLGVTMSRDDCSLESADLIFNGHRLTGKIILGQRKEDPSQRKLDGMDDTDHIVLGTFDCKSIRATPKKVGTGLTWSLEDVDMNELYHFANGRGQLFVETSAELPPKKPKANKPKEAPAAAPAEATDGEEDSNGEGGTATKTRKRAAK